MSCFGDDTEIDYDVHGACNACCQTVFNPLTQLISRRPISNSMNDYAIRMPMLKAFFYTTGMLIECMSLMAITGP